MPGAARLGRGGQAVHPCLLTGPTTPGFAGFAAPLVGCSCSTHVWPTAVSRARSLRDIADYVRSGQSVQAVVGVGGSPSCGVRTTLDLKGVLDTIAACDPTQLNTDDFNRRVIVAHARPGQGMFIAALRRQLRRRGVDVPFDEHDLIVEITH